MVRQKAWAGNGHDPGLQQSSTIADYCFFADYYFQPKPNRKSELCKYKLAEALYSYIRRLTDGQISDDKVLITNLCNETLPSSPKGKTNYIPLEEAEAGLKAIRTLLKDSSVKLIFSMSQQVNYWLQKLGFYGTDTGFLDKSEPKENGIKSKPSYYSPGKSGAFKEICGNKYVVDNQYYLFPILHVKNYPLEGNFLTYEENYSNCKTEAGRLIDSLKARNEDL
ncbi:hypothetical protein ACFLX3_05510 [Chloroflexota bacterium]